MAKKKGKGFFSAIGKALGSIPVVAKVKKAAKTVKNKIKTAKKKLKNTVKKILKKVKKKIGKVYTKARKIKNNLSKSKIVRKIKRAVKKAVLATKKAVKKVKSTVKKAVKTVKKATKVAVKQVKKAAKKVGGKVAVAYTSFKEGGYKDVISAGLDFIPIVGNAKALVEAAIGRDPITGRKLESWERGASVAAIIGGPLVKGVKHGVKLGAKAVSGATSGSKATNKTVSLAKSPTPTNPPKQQAPSQASKEASATTAPPAKSKEQGTGKPQKQKKRQSEKKSSIPQTGNGPYSHLKDSKFVGQGKDFTAAQKRKIIEENMKRNGGVVKSDSSGQVLTKPEKSKKGVTPDPNEWQIDHITPKDKGGSNSYSNAQVLSRKENRDKSNKLPSDLDKPKKETPPTKPKRRK